VFEELFADAGASLSNYLTLTSTDILARHAWSATERLDLFADAERSADAIGAFAGKRAAEGFRAFSARARRVYQTLEGPFIRAPRPTALSLAAASGPRAMLGISPFGSLWKALGEHFRDPRLRQLFGRYATYSGSSPFDAPATLMLIAHVEQQGVWLVQGGMVRLARALADLAAAKGAVVRCGAPVAEILVSGGRASGVRLASGERIESDAVICAADYAALASGAFGRAAARSVPAADPRGRSLSAVTWAVSARAEGFPLTRHNVFFSRDYPLEFNEILRQGKLPTEPTVYVCAQDRGEPGVAAPDGAERLLVLVNAPPVGDRRDFTQQEIEQCATRTFGLMERMGLTLRREQEAVATPGDFNRLFPATGGALYGQAVHGSMAAFKRPGARSALPGLYLAGGSVHPGPGVPMAALSGRVACSSVLADLTSP
jgi:1-hydroxycarotenoid 3,4-desaturase